MTPPIDKNAAPAAGKSVTRSAVVALVAVAAIALAYVFWPSKPVYQPSTLDQKGAETAMVSDLVGLEKQEALFYRVNGRFTTRAESTFFLQSFGVSAPSITLRDSGYYATVTHKLLPGVTCAVAVSTTNPLDRKVPDAQAVCK